MIMLKRGSRGDMVKAVQYIVGAAADGIFGAKTETAVMNYQKRYGLDADGIVGRNTYRKIVDNAPTLRFGSTGIYVNALEVLITTMKPDGVYTSDEIAHVKTYQASKDLEVDGVVGKKTWSALFGLSAGTVAPSMPTNPTQRKSCKNFKQYSEPYASHVYTKNGTYNKKQTIRNSGCGPTAMADVVYEFWDKKVTPIILADYSVKHGYRTENSGTAWGFFRAIANYYHASTFIQTDSFEAMRNCLATGGLVVVSFRPSKWTKGGWRNGLLTR